MYHLLLDIILECTTNIFPDGYIKCSCRGRNKLGTFLKRNPNMNYFLGSSNWWTLIVYMKFHLKIEVVNNLSIDWS